MNTRSFADWLDNVMASTVESITCSNRFTNPVDILAEAERTLIDTTGYNLNHQYVDPTKEA